MNSKLKALQVVGNRYRESRLAQDDERCLDAYAAAGVYGAAGVPFEIVEPRLPEAARTDYEPDNLGRLGGEIATAVANAYHNGRSVLMTGGDCNHLTGMIGGLQDAFGPTAKIGLVWFDAHGDFNTPHTTISGMLGGMPVAVAAGLAYPRWREGSHIVAPLPTDRIVMVDVRNLDPAEETLIRATDVTIAQAAPGFQGDVDLATAVTNLAAVCDLLYFHIDSDILDEAYVPNHHTREPNGPGMTEVKAAIETVMASGKVAALGVVSVFGGGPAEQRARSVASGCELIETGLKAWQKYGRPLL
jgi:arginase